MDYKEQDTALQVDAEAHRDKPTNYSNAEERDVNDDAENKKSEESRRKKHDADSGNDGFNEMLQKENLIDPGNEHNHDRGAADKNSDSSPQHDADSGGDASGTLGPEPGKS